MAIDTIFLCFCEDSDKNDGIKKPYYMSTGLMVKFYQDSTWVKSFSVDNLHHFYYSRLTCGSVHLSFSII